jgi:hypothetical protein
MAGLLVFRRLADALHEGYAVYDRTQDGYLVRKRVNDLWALAIVDCTGKSNALAEHVDSAQIDYGITAPYPQSPRRSFGG